MKPEMQYVHNNLSEKKELPSFKAGDNISVAYQIKEGEKSRTQVFKGDVIQINGIGATKTFTVRKLSNGVGVERVFPLSSPFIESITVHRTGKVRRAKLYYLRDRKGKAARIKEKRTK